MIYDNHNKTITTKRLLLRLFQTSDASDVTRLCDNYNIYKNTLYLPYPYSIEDALLWIENHFDNFNNNRSYEIGITDKATGNLYGAIALTNNQKFKNGEIAYWIGKELWGSGYATEAGEAILEFAFLHKQYHKVYARHCMTNPASGRVIQKIGMMQEGILRDHVMKENQYVDLVYYGIIN